MLIFGTGPGEPNGGDSWENTYIPNRSAPNSFAAVFWDDIKVKSGAILRYQVFGSAPNRYLAVEWNKVGHYDDQVNLMTFEAILYEGSNDIKFQYQTMTVNTRGSGTEAAIGLENQDGTRGVQVSYRQATIRDNMAILFQYAP